jgi:hypothetical protein
MTREASPTRPTTPTPLPAAGNANLASTADDDAERLAQTSGDNNNWAKPGSIPKLSRLYQLSVEHI